MRFVCSIPAGVVRDAYFQKDIAMFDTMPDQFVLWKSVPQMPPAKPRKVPCDATGAPTNHLDPEGFMTYKEAVTVAQKSGFFVGFVLTDKDPYFLFDLDDVRDPVTGEWDAEAIAASDLFPGAAKEVSHSQTGMHIYGRADAEVLRTKKRKWNNNKFEFYSEKRFVALGHGAQGDIDVDWTKTLAGMIPEREVADLEVNHDGPVEEFTGGAWSDEELIQKMLSASGSAATQFGDKAPVKSLWAADANVLAGHFPSPGGDAFDHSSADAALMAHLAFWTGKDYQRMQRLFEASGLMREKFQKRPDYRMNTITGAIAGCRNVYSVEQKPLAKPVDAPAGEFMLIHDQIEHFAKCIYVASHNAILTSTGAMLGQQQFRAQFGGYQFQISASNGTSSWTKNAWEAFTENRAHRFPNVFDTTFDPTGKFQDILIDPDGIKRVNIYQPRSVRRVSGNAGPFLSLLGKMIPDERDRAILVSYMAAVCQYPGRKFLWAPVVQGAQGNGKSTLISVLQYAVDGITQGVDDQASRLSVELLPRHLDSRFNAPMQNKTLAVVHEMHTDSFKDQRERQDYLKSLITESTLTIERKGMDQFTARNHMNFMFCSNHRDAVRLESSERRFAVFYTAQQSKEDVAAMGVSFPDLWSWLRGDGFAIVYDYLMTYDIPEEFDPAGGATRAPVTSSTSAAVAESRSPIEAVICEAIADNEPGFRGGWLSSGKVDQLCEARGIKAPTGRAVSSLFRSLGCSRIGRARTLFEDGGTSTLWHKNRLVEDQNINHAPSHLIEKYRADQGYSTRGGLK